MTEFGIDKSDWRNICLSAGGRSVESGAGVESEPLDVMGKKISYGE